MDSLNLADTFITFFALFGPQKVLLSFARLSRTLDDRSVRAVAAATVVLFLERLRLGAGVPPIAVQEKL